MYFFFFFYANRGLKDLILVYYTKSSRIYGTRNERVIILIPDTYENRVIIINTSEHPEAVSLGSLLMAWEPLTLVKIKKKKL